MEDYTPVFQEAIDNFHKMFRNFFSIDWVIKLFHSEMNNKVADELKGLLLVLGFFGVIYIIKKNF